ncbi:MAG: hypothetical protein WAQ98_24655 [Blastocatellia bacterium]
MQKIISFLQEQSKILGNWANTFWQVLIVVTLAKLIIAFNTYGTNDVAYFEKFLRAAKDFGPAEIFNQVWHYNFPMFCITWLYFIDFISNSTGLPFSFWFRVPAILADLGNLLLLLSFLPHLPIKNFSTAKLFLISLSPISIMVAGFHGNYDPILIFFILLSVYFLTNNKPVWLAGIALGMSLNFKIVALMLIPAFFFYLPDFQKRRDFFLAVGLTFLAGEMPYILQIDLSSFYKHVFNYNSQYGIWGLPRLLSSSLPESLSWVNTFYATKSKYIILSIIALLSLWMNFGKNKLPLFIQCGVIFFVFLAISSGFGVQYLAWLVPWVIVLDLELIVLFYFSSGLFLFLVYNFWSQGFPWNFANSDVAGPWTGYIIYYEILCWAVVLAVAFNYLKLVISLKKTEIVKPA